MPAPPLSHTFEAGQADGTGITTANSATGGNAFQTVSPSTGGDAAGQPTYDDRPLSRALACT
jgi:hypothetical protein